MDHRQRAVHRCERAQHRQRDRMVAAQRQHARHLLEQGAGTALDRRDRVGDAERAYRQVAAAATCWLANGSVPVAGLYGRSSLDDSLMCAGPNLAPGR